MISIYQGRDDQTTGEGPGSCRPSPAPRPRDGGRGRGAAGQPGAGGEAGAGGRGGAAGPGRHQAGRRAGGGHPHPRPAAGAAQPPRPRPGHPRHAPAPGSGPVSRTARGCERAEDVRPANSGGCQGSGAGAPLRGVRCGQVGGFYWRGQLSHIFQGNTNDPNI